MGAWEGVEGGGVSGVEELRAGALDEALEGYGQDKAPERGNGEQHG